MKCHDWIFLIFTTIICCTATISIAQAQQRGRVKFALSPQRDESDPIPSPELASRANRPRTSIPRASTRFRSSEQSSISSPVLESKETPRTPVQRSRSRPSNRSSQKLDTEATELVPSFRARKRGNSVPANDQPTRVRLPTANVERPNVDRPNADRSNIDRPIVDRPIVDRPNVDRPIADRLNVDRPIADHPNEDRPNVDRPNADRPNIDRANIIRQSKSRPETISSTTSAPSSSTTPHFRRKSDSPIEESSENVRKVRTFSRSVTRRSDPVLPSPEGPLITTARNDWRTAGSRRGSAKAKLSERIPKSLDDEAEDQLEDENYPEHFKILLKKQKPKTHLSPRNLPRPPLPEDPSFSRSNEIYDSTKSPLRPRRLEQFTQENSDEILQVSRAIPKVRRVELKREDTARAALKSRRVEPPSEETKSEDVPKVPSKLRRIDPSVSQLLNEDIPRLSFKSRRAEAPSENVSRSSFKSRRNEPLREPPTETKQNEPTKALFKSRRIEAQPEEKPNEIVEPSVKRVKPLFIPRRAEPYRPKPTSSTPRSTTTAKSNKKPETQNIGAKYKPRINNRLQFPSLRTKTTPTPPEDPIKDDNEIVIVRPNPKPIRTPQITKSRNLAFDRPIVDTKSKSKTQKFSSRYRGDAFSRYQQKSDTSKPIYTPTIPAVTTEPIPPQSDLPSSRTAKSTKLYNPESHDLIQSDNKYAGVVFDEKAGVWNMVEPIPDGLTRSEISVDSVDEHPAQPSVTVSIFEALADILSKTPTTSTTTTTTTTSTTTSTTELPEIIQVPEIKVDSMQISSTTVNTHLITDVDDDYTTTTNEITNFDRNGRILNRVDINQIPSIRSISPFRTSPNPIESSLETTTLTLTTQNTDTTLEPAPNTESETEQELDQTTLPDYTDLTTLALAPAPTQPTYSNTNTELTNSNTSILELTTLSSIPPTNLPLPHLADALTTPGSSLVTQPQLISAISNFLDTSVQNASDTMATSTTTADITTTLETNTDTESINTSDASQTLAPTTHTITTRSSSSTESPPVTISFLDLFTIQPKKVNSNTEPIIDIHPIYREPDPTTTPADKNRKTLPPASTTGQPVNIQTFFRTQTYPSITITGGTSTDRIRELSTTFLIPSSEDTVTDGVTTETLIPSTTTHDQDTSISTTSIDYTTSPQSTQTQSSLPIHLNSILGSTQKYDQTSPTKTTAQTETTTTIRSRFGNNRLPILPAGSGRFNNKPTTTTSTTSTTTTTTTSKTTSTSTTAGLSSTSSSVTPPTVRVLPKQRQLSNSTPLPTQQQQQPNVIQDFSVYGILPNNTVVRKRPPEVSRTLDVGVMVYGILPNQTVVRKYPNGTLAIVDSSKDVEVVDIDPKMLFNPFSELYRTSQSSLLLTTHRSTTSHRLIESNDIVSSVPRSSSSTALPISTTNTIGTRRTGISIKESTDNGNPDAITTNGDDDNLIQLLSENEDNLLNSTSLVEPNTENAVLLDLLKRKYLNSDLPSKSSNVVSFTTVRNMIEESSIQANKEEDVSENTLLDSSEEKRKDTSVSTSSEEDLLGKLFPSNSPTEPNTDDDNIISHHFDNVERGSIFAGNKEPKKVDNKQTPTIYLVTPGTTIPTTTLTSTTPSTTTTTTTPSTTTSTTSTTTTTTPSTTTPTTTSSTTTTTTEPPTTTTTTTTTEPPTTTTTTTTTTTPIPTTISTTPLTTSSLPSTTVSRQQNLEVNELEKNIKLLQQLLVLQGSLKRKSTTSTSSSTTTTSSTTPSTSSSTTPATTKPPVLPDDAFLNTLRQLLLAQQRTTKKPTTSSSTTTTTTSTTTTTPKPTITTISPQNLQDFLNSFSTPSFSTTTSKDDIDFLNSLRDIGKLKVTTSVPPTFANRIIELALQNRQVTPTAPVYIPARISTTPPPFTPLPEIRRPTLLPSNDIENHRQDQASLSADLSLLSTLLGRRITVADLPQLTQQFGGNRRPAAPSRRPMPRTTTTTTTSTEKPMTRNEIAEIEKNLNLLSSLLGRPVSLNELPLIMQDLRSGRKPKATAPGARINLISPVAMKTTTTNPPRTTLSVQSQTPISQEEVIELLKDPSFATSPEHLNIYGNSNDAVLAAVLKQRGIGPTHNNIPINDLFLQGPTPTPYRTTRPPKPPPPTQPQRRPILDGLAWLWRAWQDTAPGTRPSKNRQPEAAASTRLESPIVIANTAGSGEGGEYADLQYPKNPTNPSLGQGNGLLTAAFGVTRAVTQFLGAAFQGAAQSVQSAFSPQALRQNNLMSLSG